MKLAIESGKKKTFAIAVDWPGFARSGRDEAAALAALVAYGPRYGRILRHTDLEFEPPTETAVFTIGERHPGSSSTDFGAPGAVLDADHAPFNQEALARAQTILQACWRGFDEAAAAAEGKTLRTGPRGGGRDVAKMSEHVLEADGGYLRRLAWKHKRNQDGSLSEEITRMRAAILEALQTAVAGNLPTQGPRGGVLWLPHTFVRRVAWHVLDHVWEIEDRIE